MPGSGICVQAGSGICVQAGIRAYRSGAAVMRTVR